MFSLPAGLDGISRIGFPVQRALLVLFLCAIPDLLAVLLRSGCHRVFQPSGWLHIGSFFFTIFTGQPVPHGVSLPLDGLLSCHRLMVNFMHTLSFFLSFSLTHKHCTLTQSFLSLFFSLSLCCCSSSLSLSSYIYPLRWVVPQHISLLADNIVGIDSVWH